MIKSKFIFYLKALKNKLFETCCYLSQKNEVKNNFLEQRSFVRIKH